MADTATFKTGQCWHYRTPEGFETSRIVIGAIASFSANRRIICVSVTDAPERESDGTIRRVVIPFLAMSEAALAATVTDHDAPGAAQLAPAFAVELETWRNDPRGLTCFTVPFEGSLNLLIAQQMAAIIDTNAA